MVNTKQRKAIKDFVNHWNSLDKTSEKKYSQKFWLSLLQNVLGIEHPEYFIDFEEDVALDNTSYIDGFISSTKVLIEQKSSDKDLNQPIKQSDGTFLTPYEQAIRYRASVPYSKQPRWIVTCNFQKFLIYDMETPKGEPQEVLLKNLEKEYYRLSFLVDTHNEHIKKEEQLSIEAGEIVGRLYDALLKQYVDKTSKETLKSLNKLCVRLVFCLYAEDAGIFGERDMFLNYMKQFEPKHMRKALIELFKILNIEEKKRDPYLDEELKAFPFVNGGLFKDNDIEIPNFTEEIKELLLIKASENFNWSEISPTIFGAVFESTLNPETRHNGGMHYTSIENIHRVIDPLFLNDLKQEFNEICCYKNYKIRKINLDKFQHKIANLTFLDPACGSGNFLTETYISLRKLENEIIEILGGNKNQTWLVSPVKVSINQFYGIEINDFAATVAQTALWIAESQMLKETENIIKHDLKFLPLTTNSNIVEGNALRIDWQDVIPKEKLNYIIGNPPFVGESKRTKDQSNDMAIIFGKGNSETKLDYVICWYKKAMSLMISNTSIKCAFVSTNSICQGESVPTFWKHLSHDGAEIQFAYRSFLWRSESIKEASVFCVIIGFTACHINNKKKLFDNDTCLECDEINAYLYAAPNTWIENRSKERKNNFPPSVKGSEPTPVKPFMLSGQEAECLKNKYPKLNKYIRGFIGGDEVISNKPNTFTKYCLWFKDGNPADYNKIPEIVDRLKTVRDTRLNSPTDRIIKKANVPYLFCQIRQPKNDYIIIPRISTDSRTYRPIAYISKDIICGDTVYAIPSASLYVFGILNSKIHNLWDKTVSGRLGNAPRYSPAVYNNFPCKELTESQKSIIEKTAQAILDARALYPNCSLEDLYKELTMPIELRKAHQENDKIVMEVYGFRRKDKNGKIVELSETEIITELFKMYKKLSNKK